MIGMIFSSFHWQFIFITISIEEIVYILIQVEAVISYRYARMAIFLCKKLFHGNLGANVYENLFSIPLSNGCTNTDLNSERTSTKDVMPCNNA